MPTIQMTPREELIREAYEQLDEELLIVKVKARQRLREKIDELLEAEGKPQK